MKNLENLREAFVANPWMLFVVFAPVLLSNTHFFTPWILPRKLAVSKSRRKPTGPMKKAGETDSDEHLNLRAKIWDISITIEHYLTLLLFGYAVLLLAYRDPKPIEKSYWEVTKDLVEIIWMYIKEMVIKLAGYGGLSVTVTD